MDTTGPWALASIHKSWFKVSGSLIYTAHLIHVQYMAQYKKRKKKIQQYAAILDNKIQMTDMQLDVQCKSCHVQCSDPAIVSSMSPDP